MRPADSRSPTRGTRKAALFRRSTLPEAPRRLARRSPPPSKTGQRASRGKAVCCVGEGGVGASSPLPRALENLHARICPCLPTPPTARPDRTCGGARLTGVAGRGFATRRALAAAPPPAWTTCGQVPRSPELLERSGAHDGVTRGGQGAVRLVPRGEFRRPTLLSRLHGVPSEGRPAEAGLQAAPFAGGARASVTPRGGPHRHRRHQCRPGHRRCELPQLPSHGQDLLDHHSRALTKVHELVEVPRFPVLRR